MSFSSITYLVFFAVVGLLMAATNLLKSRLSLKNVLTVRHGILLAASYVFYGWWDYRFCFLMLLLTGAAYICARVIAKRERFEKPALVCGVAIPLLVLGFFKYFNFFIDSFADVFSITSASSLSIILPVGISFYTFQSMSYVIDVSRKRVEVQRSFFDVALYISFFPQLVAGPIVKAGDFLPQLKEDRNISLKNLEKGVQIFLLGMFKKVVIADNISVFADDVFSKPRAFAGMTVVLAVISYAIQIYFDFSGYSDMAIGSAKCLGYELNRNFNLPYLSKNPSEFWKRWHISLSSWLQEYLYIPLGGNRKGTARTYINLIITMVLGGLWHGANWTFVLWGLYHGIGLCAHKLYCKMRNRDKNFSGNAAANLFSRIFTMIFVCLGWVLFRADTPGKALSVFKAMFTMQEGISQPFFWSFAGIGVAVVIGIVSIVKSKKSRDKTVNAFYPELPLDKIWGLTVFVFCVFMTICFAYTGSNPFIYFQF